MAKQGKRGRPRALADSALREEVLKVLRSGGSRTDAAAKVRVHYQTLSHEVKRDPDFLAAVLQAEADGKLTLILRINKASTSDWKAAAWLLERKYWQEWSKRNPDAISPDQLASAFSRLVALLLTELPPEFHERVQRRVEEIITSLRG